MPRYSIRALLLGVMLVAIALGYCSDVLFEYRSEQALYGVAHPGILTEPVGYDWMPGCIDERYFHRAVKADLCGRYPERIDASTIGSLRQLRYVAATGECFNDQSITGLRPLSKLENLFLSHSRIGNASLDTIGLLKNLRRLKLDHTGIRDPDFGKLAGLKYLHRLDLGSTDIADTQVRQLRVLQNLEQLDLSYTKITDLCIADLVGLPKLQRIVITGTAITDDGIAKLQEAMPSLAIRGWPW